ncbi:hypothetical protein BC833DRAFT_579673 [Globomyces pollinis-pini]|nr:hypothetical protein BC833DRAFT_579673 [Globomyces pollinis-pini]KAJ2994239.1 hypothetical protein HDV02_001741 [Globomyces sp. JEL0801]
MKFFVSCMAMLAAVQAHLQLKTPIPRSNDEFGQEVGPCGKDANTPGVRAIVSGGKLNVRLAVGHSNSFIHLNLANGPNPTEFPLEVFSKLYSRPSWQNIPVNLTAFSSVTNGPATLQIVSDSEHGLQYICADLTIEGI